MPEPIRPNVLVTGGNTRINLTNNTATTANLYRLTYDVTMTNITASTLIAVSPNSSTTEYDDGTEPTACYVAIKNPVYNQDYDAMNLNFPYWDGATWNDLHVATTSSSSGGLTDSQLRATPVAISCSSGCSSTGTGLNEEQTREIWREYGIKGIALAIAGLISLLTIWQFRWRGHD